MWACDFGLYFVLCLLMDISDSDVKIELWSNTYRECHCLSFYFEIQKERQLHCLSITQIAEESENKCQGLRVCWQEQITRTSDIFLLFSALNGTLWMMTPSDCDDGDHDHDYDGDGVDCGGLGALQCWHNFFWAKVQACSSHCFFWIKKRDVDTVNKNLQNSIPGIVCVLITHPSWSFSVKTWFSTFSILIFKLP